MSSSTSGPRLHKFVLFAPDAKDSPRLAVMQQHRSEIKPFVGSGVVKVAGMAVLPESIEYKDAPVKPVGSLIIYEAENINIVRKMVEEDVYYTSGVVSTS
ncbi:hypothetical protein GYMLUDRAFT_67616 [Collybiopsis luxurians FD-317 M1]|nr:hypothetical protein GYMLUDRAFT_67616 [Collybiopsis luxurians FD-317 M1]